MFSPHKFETQFFGVPSIKLTEQCARDMWQLVQVVDIEVGWFCVCRQDKGDFILTEVQVPTQTCTATETDMSTAGLAELGMKLMTEDNAAGVKVDSPDYRCNHLNCWVH